MDKIKDQICLEIDSLEKDLFAVSDFLLGNPETAFQDKRQANHTG